MTKSISRRHFLIGLAGISAVGSSLVGSPTVMAVDDRVLGPMQPFDFERLRAAAREMAMKPYSETPIRDAELLHTIDFDAYQKIRFRSERSLWADGKGPYTIQCFHLGRYFKQPVKIYLVEGRQAREVLYSSDYFSFGDPTLAKKLPANLGFAGFRVMHKDGESDWLSFLGASYFRSAGELNQYGLSARGIAIDTGLMDREEFPRFTRFWLEPSSKDPAALVIYALLDGPSITGAYRIEASKGQGVVMTVRAELFARTDIERMGIAPLTSMFWFDTHNRHVATDWRPEIHDSDGLAIWSGTGERIWRPLNNAPSVQTNTFYDNNPRGFGLLQRDRSFANYEDDSVFYERRPSVWVEPLGPWGEGGVQLVEIPTDDEIYDNIVAYWLPQKPVTAGSEWSFQYRLYWLADEPASLPSVAKVVATRTGQGGVAGQIPRPKEKRKFVIDFAGGQLEGLAKQDPVQATTTTSRGTIDDMSVFQVVTTKKWRVRFDLNVDGDEPVDLRCFLRLGDQALTETWLYQYLPLGFEKFVR
jgi:periplasmic glucans biosynthesis protein